MPEMEQKAEKMFFHSIIAFELRSERCSEMGLFRYLSNNIFGSLKLWKYIGCNDHLFFKCLKSDVNSRNGTKS